MIKVEFFKQGTIVYAIIDNAVSKRYVIDVKIQTQPELSIVYTLGLNPNLELHNSRKIDSNEVYEKPEALLDSIKNQIKALKNDN